MKKLNKKGFTIVELVIVIGVIGILSAILIPTFVNLTSQAQETQLQSNLTNAYKAYIAEAVDGKIDADSSAIVSVEENKAILKEEDGSKLYHFDVETTTWKEYTDNATNAAAVMNKAATGTWTLTDVAETAGKSTFGGYVVRYYKDVTA